MAMTSEQVSITFRDREPGELITIEMDDGDPVSGQLKHMDDPELDPLPGILALGSVVVEGTEGELRVPFASIRSVRFPHDPD